MSNLFVEGSFSAFTIINAFAHNDYSLGYTPIFEIFSDKFVITSYGGLVGGLSLEKFYGGTSMPRNREIMRIFKDLEFVDQLGSGMPKIIEKYGKKVVSIDGQVMQVILKFDKNIENSDEKSREKILAIIKENPRATTAEIAETIGLTAKAIEKNLKNLKKENLIRRIGADNGGY